MPTSGAVIEIGAQQLSNTFLRARDRLELLGQLFGATAKLDLPVPGAPTIVGGVEPLSEIGTVGAPVLGVAWLSICLD